MTEILAADIGGTNIRAAVVSTDGEIIHEQHARMPLGDREITANLLVDKLAAFFAEMLLKERGIDAIGIGFPGFFMGRSGLLAASPNLPNLANINLAEMLANTLHLPVHMQNDALCAAIGEHRFGAGRGHTSLLHLTLGTGIGGGLILNDAPYFGDGGMAMEFGHLRVTHGDDALICGCGGRGCVEAYASATAIARRYASATGIEADGRDIHERAITGDTTAREIITSAGTYLGMAIAEAVKLLDVHTVTISGGLSGAWEMLHPAMTTSLDNNLIPPLKGEVNVLRSTLNDDAGLLGAAALATA